jgi:hypothetical protein
MRLASPGGRVLSRGARGLRCPPWVGFLAFSTFCADGATSLVLGSRTISSYREVATCAYVSLSLSPSFDGIAAKREYENGRPAQSIERAGQSGKPCVHPCGLALESQARHPASLSSKEDFSKRLVRFREGNEFPSLDPHRP